MTVKCLSHEYKEAIVDDFTTRGVSIDELAVNVCRSRRTVIRVLEEAGVDPGIRRRKPKAVKPHEDVGFPFDFSEVTLLPKLNWFQRAINKVARSLALN